MRFGTDSADLDKMAFRDVPDESPLEKYFNLDELERAFEYVKECGEDAKR